MTYNFDAEGWFERQRRRLLARQAAGELDEEALAAALERLEAGLEALEARLDGSFQVGPLAAREET